MRKPSRLLPIVLAAALLATPALPALAGLAAGPSRAIVADPALVTNHAVALTNLTPGTTYFYTATSCDAAGNCTSAPQQQLTTLAAAGTPVPTPSGDVPCQVTRDVRGVVRIQCG